MKTNEELHHWGLLPSPPDAAWKTQLSRQPAAEPRNLPPPTWPLARLEQTPTTSRKSRRPVEYCCLYSTSKIFSVTFQCVKYRSCLFGQPKHSTEKFSILKYGIILVQENLWWIMQMILSGAVFYLMRTEERSLVLKYFINLSKKSTSFSNPF